MYTVNEELQELFEKYTWQDFIGFAVIKFGDMDNHPFNESEFSEAASGLIDKLNTGTIY